jgi:hypothetical protein
LKGAPVRALPHQHHRGRAGEPGRPRSIGPARP